uniref:Tick transposon n=1 Tax=Mesocestoides corti TaxID=53468 RepID=A0A5K3G1H6_MESCO
KPDPHARRRSLYTPSQTCLPLFGCLSSSHAIGTQKFRGLAETIVVEYVCALNRCQCTFRTHGIVRKRIRQNEFSLIKDETRNTALNLVSPYRENRGFIYVSSVLPVLPLVRPASLQWRQENS